MKSVGVTRREFIGGATAAVSVALLPRIGLAREVLAGGADSRSAQDDMGRDLLEVTIPKLRAFYETKKYTTTQVTRWYLSRIRTVCTFEETRRGCACSLVERAASPARATRAHGRRYPV